MSRSPFAICAGIWSAHSKISTDPEFQNQVWRDQIDINLTGAWNTLQATVPILVEQGQGGAIVLTSSTAGVHSMAVNDYAQVREVIDALEAMKLPASVVEKVAFANYARVLKAALADVPAAKGFYEQLFAPLGVLPWGIGVLAILSALTVAQRTRHVLAQMDDVKS